jgi:hypothetical protein
MFKLITAGGLVRKSKSNNSPQMYIWQQKDIIYVLLNTPLQVPHMSNRVPVFDINMSNRHIIHVQLHNYL